MVLRATWGSLGPLLGALWGLLGLSFGFQTNKQELATIELTTCWALVGLFWSRLAASSGSFFFEVVVHLFLERRLWASKMTLRLSDVDNRIRNEE